MKQLPTSQSNPVRIPDCWPGKALRATINESRPVFQGKRVLVTGICSFMGGHLARALDAAGAEVIGFDANTNPSSDCQLHLNGLHDQIELFEGDITHRAQMEELVLEGEFAYIFLIATNTGKGANDLTNAQGFINLAEGARLLPEAKRPVIIYSSTDNAPSKPNALPHVEEYDLGGGRFDAADTLAATYYESYQVPTTALRLCDVFGPYDLNFDEHTITGAMRNIFRDSESPEMPLSTIGQFHDYLYVDDAVRAYLHIARSKNCLGQAYNLPGTHYASTPDVIRDIVTLLGDLQQDESALNANSAFANHRWNRSIRVIPSEPEWDAVYKMRLEGERIEQDAGFVPFTEFKEGLDATARFYLWYFSRATAVAKVEVSLHDKTSVGRGISLESGFETVFTDDGLPVFRLKSGTPKQKTEVTYNLPEPTQIQTEAYPGI